MYNNIHGTNIFHSRFAKHMYAVRTYVSRQYNILLHKIRLPFIYNIYNIIHRQCYENCIIWIIKFTERKIFLFEFYLNFYLILYSWHVFLTVTDMNVIIYNINRVNYSPLIRQTRVSVSFCFSLVRVNNVMQFFFQKCNWYSHAHFEHLQLAYIALRR